MINSIFISKGNWFDKGTICIRLIETIDGDGIFLGMKDGKLDEEMCSIEEFEEIILENNNV